MAKISLVVSLPSKIVEAVTCKYEAVKLVILELDALIKLAVRFVIIVLLEDILLAVRFVINASLAVIIL